MEQSYSNLDALISQFSLIAVGIASALLIFLSIASLKIKHPGPSVKKILFLSFAAVAVSCTLFLAGSTIYLNVVSSSRGPVHYHADFEIFKCGEELELVDPEGFSNKVGTAAVHEHNDKKIHIEGVIVSPSDASIGNFFRATGGTLENDLLTISSHDGQVTLKSGDNCPDTPNTQLQVFLYKVQGKHYSQARLEDPQNYIISPQQNVPPGDCIIIELDQLKEKTDKLCQSFEVAKQIGEISEFKN